MPDRDDRNPEGMQGLIDRLYLELAEWSMTKTKRERELEELLTCARCIAERQGKDTAWDRFSRSIGALGIGSITARTYRVLPSDTEDTP